MSMKIEVVITVDDLQLDYHMVQALLFHLFPVPYMKRISNASQP